MSTCSEIVTLVYKSSALRVNCGCLSVLSITMRSPGSPSTWGSPSPRNLDLCPSGAPTSTCKYYIFNSLKNVVHLKVFTVINISVAFSFHNFLQYLQSHTSISSSLSSLTNFTLGHSSHTVCCIIWNLPGPKFLVTISCLQLHLRVPGAGLITGLFLVIC